MKKYFLWLLLTLLTLPAFPQFIISDTLIGTGSVKVSGHNFQYQGVCSAISADGMVAVVSSMSDSASTGAVWIFANDGGKWKQMGKKLIQNIPVITYSYPSFGSVSAISADGSTIALGGLENGNGAIWIYVRIGNSWVQQGPRLIGNQKIGSSGFSEIALSADGNTLLVGGPNDNGDAGAAWIFQRTGTTWSQQGNKISISNWPYRFGSNVALSSDGNTALIGAPWEGTQNNLQGAAYFYKRKGTTWIMVQRLTEPMYSNGEIGQDVALSGDGLVAGLGAQRLNRGIGLILVFRFNSITQQWTKEETLYPKDPYYDTFFGGRITLSKDGNTLASAGVADNNQRGAVWTFAYSNGNWAALGNKIIPPVSGMDTFFGQSVSLSADGKTLLIGRPGGDFPGCTYVYRDTSTVKPEVTIQPEVTTQPEISPYPNPVEDILYLPPGISFNQVFISDLRGKVLLQKVNPAGLLDLSVFSTGIYILSLHQQNKVQHFRILKE